MGDPGGQGATGLLTALALRLVLSPFARAVLDVVDSIPRGRVLTYGDVAELVGSRGARAVGAVMARCGVEVPWHRVVLSSGRPAPGHETEALRRLAGDGVPLLGDRVDLSRARWDGRVGRPRGRPTR